MRTVHTRRLLAAFGVALLLLTAGCSGLGGDGGTGDDTPDEATAAPTDEATPTPAEYPSIFRTITASVDSETADAFAGLVTDQDGTLTDDGTRLLDRLEAVDELGETQRDAVVTSIVDRGSLDGVVETLDTLLASPDAFAADTLSEGLADSDSDGLLDGEAAALGLNLTDPDDRAVTMARQLRDGGYGERDIVAIQRFTELDSFERTQAAEFGLVDSLTDGEVTADDLAALRDTSGDGLLDVTVTELGLDPEQKRDRLATVAASLDEAAFSFAGTRYLERYAAVLASAATRQQAIYLDLSEDIGPETLSEEDVAALADDDDDGLITAMERELGLDPDEANPDIGEVTARLAQGGYSSTDRQFLDRLVELREYKGHGYELWAQAEQLGLLGPALENGSVTDSQLQALENDDTDRLLNGIEREFGTDPETSDTSGDGFADHLLWGPMQDLGLDVSPDSPNVFVEVDTVEGVAEPSDQQIEAIQGLFSEEPPDEIGEINVQFRVCHVEQDDVAQPEEMIGETADDRNITGLGFHYLLLSDGLVAGGTQGATLTLRADNEQYANLTSWMVVDGTIWRNRGELHQAGTIAHELGHALGIGGDVYLGVDSFEVSAEKYESIMNYNYPIDDLTFSTGDPFDDYEQMASQSFGSDFQDRGKLEAMWDAGDAEEDALC